MRRLLLCLTLVALPSSAVAADWRLVGSTSIGQTFVDVDSIRPYQGWLRAWTRAQYYQPRGGFKEQRFVYLFDCAEERTAVKTSVSYSADEVKADTVTNTDDMLEWNFIVPQSIGAKALKVVCSSR